MRIAWFSPLPPVRTGIAACSAELVTALRRRGCEIDAYPAEAAHDFPWHHRQRRYDLIVYQFGNSSHHDYEWAYALRYPGLVVMHDTHLHHARAAFLLRERRTDAYRAEFRYNHPHVSPDVAELAVAGFDNRLYYEWPMVRALLDSSRLVAVHGQPARRELLERLATFNPTTSGTHDDRVISIRLGHGDFVSDDRRRQARAHVRARYGIAEEDVVFVCAGGITPEKRIPQVIAALRAILPHAPNVRLLLAGATAAHYDVHADIDAHDVADRVIVTGYLEGDDELTDHLAASDVSLNLRWPTAGEISGPWLRALAAGVATIVTDLVHLGQVPSVDPRTWRANFTVDGSSSNASRASIAVAIDILDEDHSLRLAMRRLATDATLRHALARAGQDYWQREHTLAAMVEDYDRVMKVAAARPDPAPQLPEHMRDRGESTLRALLAPFGLEAPW